MQTKDNYVDKQYMSIKTFVICLHHGGIIKTMKFRVLPVSVSMQEQDSYFNVSTSAPLVYTCWYTGYNWEVTSQ